ncbi:hypothetical protein [Botrimarina sp.]|uniref:hypothetical protein n=1 Tax=Botrimarina sp. TaxID=2795802 RepID=UPI0032ED088C
MRKTRFFLAAPLAALFAVPAAADSRYGATPYYEEEPWYDITEWFDGDEYRKTELGEEVLDDSGEFTTDVGYELDYDYGYHYGTDGDLEYGPHYDYITEYGAQADGIDYGYDDRYESDNWFYDYWDDGYAYYRDWDDDGLYEYSTSYYDFDSDGYYDAYTSYYDWDGDGLYEDIDYFTFNQAGAQNQGQAAQQQQQGTESKRSQKSTLSGKIAKTKKVSVRDTKHVVAQLKSADGQVKLVDLGPATNLSDFDLQQGTQINASGPVATAGDKKVLVAQSAKIGGKQLQPDRSRQSLKGQVTSTRKVDIRGAKHLLVSLDTQSGGKVMVDLGEAGQLDTDLSEGDEVSVEGAPVKANDKRILIGRKLTHDGQTVSLNRAKPTRGSQSDAASGDSQQRQRQQRGADAMAQERTVRGSVTELTTAKVRDTKRQIAVIENPQGDRLKVDLGAANDFQGEVEQGDDIRVRGVMVKTRDGEPIVLARRVMKPQGDPMQVRSGQDSMRSVSGAVQSTRTVTVRGTDRRLAQIKTDDGDQLLVDLGEPNELPFDVKKGKQLKATGRLVKAKNSLVLVAFEAGADDGESKQIRRAGGRQSSDNDSND